MKKLIPLLATILFIISLTTACTVAPNSLQITGPTSPLTHSTDENRINFPADQLSVTLDNLSLMAGESTEFLVDATLGEQFTMRIQTDPELQITNAVFDPAGEPLMSGYGRMLDWRSTRTATGDFRIRITNESGTAITYDLVVRRSLFTTDQIKLDDLLAKFNAAGVEVTHTPSVQRKTAFDSLFQREMATREILRLSEPQHRVDVYIFADEATASEAAGVIEFGSNRLTRTVDGETRFIELYADAGSAPLWWQDEPFILYSASPDPVVAEQVTAVLGDHLGKPAADTVSVRLRNEESGETWQDVTLQWDDKSSEISDLVPGIGGYRAVPADQSVTVSITHDGQPYSAQIPPLDAGSYMVDLLLNDGELLARPFRDDEFFVAADLIDVTWTWQRVEYADGSVYTPYTSLTFTPAIRFGIDTSPNFGEAGQQLSGNLGCNGMGALYFANTQGDLLVSPGTMTSMLCGDEEMESETIGSTLLQSAYRYERSSGELHLITPDGDRMILRQERTLTATSQIYVDIINGWSGTNTSFLVVAKTKTRPDGVTEAEAIAGIQELFPDRGEPDLTISAEEIQRFFLQQTGVLVKIALPNGEPQLISETELETLFSDGDEAGWQAVQERYPGVEAIFAFSDVGFLGDDVSSMDEKILVYYEVRTSSGVSPYYSLRFKTGGSWQGGMTSLFRDQE